MKRMKQNFAEILCNEMYHENNPKFRLIEEFYDKGEMTEYEIRTRKDFGEWSKVKRNLESWTSIGILEKFYDKGIVDNNNYADTIAKKKKTSWFEDFCKEPNRNCTYKLKDNISALLEDNFKNHGGSKGHTEPVLDTIYDIE